MASPALIFHRSATCGYLSRDDECCAVHSERKTLGVCLVETSQWAIMKVLETRGELLAHPPWKEMDHVG